MANASPTRIKSGPDKKGRARLRADAGEFPGKADLLPVVLVEPGERPNAYLYCEPIDPALSVEAPFSRFWEAATPGTADKVAMPMPLVLSGGPSPEIEVAATECKPLPRFPKMPGPLPSAVLSNASSLDRSPREVDVPGVRSRGLGRWALLAVSFVVVALVTQFLMTGKTEPQPASANQTPAPSFENFGGGLDRWEGAETGSRPWVPESSKGVIPGSLALYKPSAGLANFRLEFLADVKKNGVSWAFRAVDSANYQGLQIIQKKTGTETQLWLSRYKVTAGKEGPRTQVQLQIALPVQSVWRIRMETSGDSCTLWVEDQIANSWSEASLPAGSIGFLAGKGEQFVLMRVRITPQ